MHNLLFVKDWGDIITKSLFGLFAAAVFFGVIGYVLGAAIMSRKSVLYPKYGKNWWKWWKHKK